MIAPAHVLAFEGVACAYTRATPVLRDVRFHVAPGEVVALLGRNGSGKSTLVHLALGLLPPDAGTVRTMGRDPLADPLGVKQRVGYAGTPWTLPPRFTGADMLAVHRRLFPTWDATLEREMLDRFGLSRKLGAIGALSRGQQQQLALLCALCHRPALLLLDEPAAGLDPVTRREFLEASLQLLNREGTAILFSSHHLSDVERLSGRVLLLRDGVIAVDEPLDALTERTCLAVVPRRVVGNVDLGTRLDGVLHTRPVVDMWHVVVRGDARAVEQRLRATLASDEVHCMPVPLEELFVELAGSADGTR